MSKRKKESRRARGTGSVFFNAARGVWVAKKAVGKTLAGKLRYVKRSDATQAGALRKLDQATGSAPPAPVGTAATLGEWLAAWHRDDTSRPATRAARNNSIANYLAPVLGGLNLPAVTAADVEAAARQWGRVLAPNSVRLVLSHLHTAYAEAIRAGLVDRNPVATSRRPRGVKATINPFTAAELRDIITTAATRRAWRIFAALAGTGCRVGEALALEVSDYNPLTGAVSISRTQGRDRKPGPTKTANGVRTITVPDLARPVLTTSAAQAPRVALFPTRSGGPDCAQNVQYSWAALLDYLGLAYRNVHQLRHSVATLAISNGVPLGDLAAYLGDTVATVVKTYLHATGANPAHALNRLLDAPKSKRVA